MLYTNLSERTRKKFTAKETSLNKIENNMGELKNLLKTLNYIYIRI